MHIAALHIYPIKSCRGLALERARLDATGLAHDRRWMLVDGEGRFVTQRELPRLALVAPGLSCPDAAAPGLRVTAPGMAELVVPGEDRSRPVTVTVWQDRCRAFDEGDAVAGWFREFLGHAVRLVRFDDAAIRLSSRDWTGALDAPNRFSDGFPLLLISQASLDDLNGRLEQPLPMNRFRPNLVIADTAAFAEDALGDFGADGVRLRVVKPCTRCVITTTDQASGLAHREEPLRTLVSYRYDRALRGVTFGQNVVIVAGIGQVLRIGERLRPLPLP